MLACFWISEPLCETEIDEIDVGRFLVTDEEVIGLDISMEVVTALNMLDPFQTLDGDHDDSLERKPLLAVAKQVF